MPPPHARKGVGAAFFENVGVFMKNTFQNAANAASRLQKSCPLDFSKKPVRIGTMLILFLLLCAAAFFYTGNDALVLGRERKDGILTAEQVKASFDSVGGRLLREAVKEGDRVKKGDVLMVLDSTDIDLSIEKTKAQIRQMEATIASTEGGIRIGYDKTDTTEVETYRAIDQQRASVDAAKATYDYQQLNYDRMTELAQAGAISRRELDIARTDYETARASLSMQQELLGKLLGGAPDTGDTEGIAIPSVVNARNEIKNQEHDLESLRQQKKQLEITLKELEVSKSRLILRAPEDGKILSVIAKEGEMVSPNTPVILLESDRLYYDIYLSEDQLHGLAEGDSVTGKAVANGETVRGTVRLIARAPGFADYKMSRENGQADLTAFQVRIDAERAKSVIPGMTVEVRTDALPQR